LKKSKLKYSVIEEKKRDELLWLLLLDNGLKSIVEGVGDFEGLMKIIIDLIEKGNE
jgi:hypothetical protein